MLDVPFTAEDVARTRFAPSPAPMIELTAALATLQRRDALFAPGAAGRRGFCPGP